MKVLIIGANLVNKGAQSMLFVTVDEIKKRFPNALVYFADDTYSDVEPYTFTRVYYTQDTKYIAMYHSVALKTKHLVKDCIKTIVGRHSNLWTYKELEHIISGINLIVDISGFNLGKKWSAEIQESYLDNIRLAKKYNIPIILMPQSFGPFDYEPEKQYLIREMADLLPYATKIFAREQEGYQMLINTFQLSNVELSTDLVLQNKGVDLNNIFKSPQQITTPDIMHNSVGIIPNKQCFNRGNREKILEIYKAVIEKIADLDKEVYIFRHSSEDLDVCKEIYSLCSDKRIHFLDNDFSCFEYDEFVKHFSFIVCSRYHGIVHAYRNCVPSVLLGWAIKYKELSELFGQARYSFDITDEKVKIDEIVSATGKMCENYKIESDTISQYLEPIQRKNCFEKVL